MLHLVLYSLLESLQATCVNTNKAFYQSYERCQSTGNRLHFPLSYIYGLENKSQTLFEGEKKSINFFYYKKYCIKLRQMIVYSAIVSKGRTVLIYKTYDMKRLGACTNKFISSRYDFYSVWRCRFFEADNLLVPNSNHPIYST